MAGELAKALVAAQKAMKDPRLTGNNPHFGSRFVPRDEALDVVLPALHDNGLALIQTPTSDENGYGVRTMLIHSSGETLDLGEFTVRPQKDDPQGAVAATTYASRTAIMLIFARAGDPDDDGNTASEKVKHDDGERRLKELKELAEQNGHHEELSAALGNPRSLKAALAVFNAMSDTEKAALELVAKTGAQVS